MTDGPLADIRVLDLCHVRAGPTAVRVLADLGAQVVQVVRPDSAPPTPGAPDFDRENLHRNKRSIAIDLQNDAGRAVFYRMIEHSDVVVENFRADVKYRLEFDYDTLARINPRIVLGSISGFGQDGPYGNRPGVDQIVQGMGGLMSVTGPPGTGPWRVGIPIADLCAGNYLAQGIMAALIERERSGRGQWVHTSLLEAMIAMLDFQATRWLIAGEVPRQAGNDHPTSIPTGVFPTKDGLVNVGSAGEKMFPKFAQVIGAPELLDDPRFATAKARSTNRDELRRIVEPLMREMTTEQLVDELNAAGVPCGPIYTIDQAFADRQVQHLMLAQPVESELYGELTLVRSPINLLRTPATLRLAAPAPGAHTQAVLRELGFSDDEIERLAASGAVGLKQTVGAW